MDNRNFDIIAIREVINAKNVQPYLDCGWVFIDSVPYHNNDGDSCITYSIGWLKNNGDIKFPDSTH